MRRILQKILTFPVVAVLTAGFPGCAAPDTRTPQSPTSSESSPARSFVPGTGRTLPTPTTPTTPTLRAPTEPVGPATETPPPGSRLIGYSIKHVHVPYALPKDVNSKNVWWFAGPGYVQVEIREAPATPRPSGPSSSPTTTVRRGFVVSLDVAHRIPVPAGATTSPITVKGHRGVLVTTEAVPQSEPGIQSRQWIALDRADGASLYVWIGGEPNRQALADFAASLSETDSQYLVPVKLGLTIPGDTDQYITFKDGDELAPLTVTLCPQGAAPPPSDGSESPNCLNVEVLRSSPAKSTLMWTDSPILVKKNSHEIYVYMQHRFAYEDLSALSLAVRAPEASKLEVGDMLAVLGSVVPDPSFR